VSADTVIRDVVEPVLRADGPLLVLAGDDLVGVIDREQLLPVIARSVRELPA
jgi:hypothetical protein